MEVQLLRAPNGDVIFLEANAEFVDVLLQLLKAPLGSVLQACSGKEVADETNGKPWHALLTLSDSMPRLRESLFSSEKSEVLPSALELTKLIEGGSQPKQNFFASTKSCLCCLKQGQVRHVDSAMWCSHCEYITLTNIGMPASSSSPFSCTITCPTCRNATSIDADGIGQQIACSLGHAHPIYSYSQLLADSSYSQFGYCSKCVCSKTGKSCCHMREGHRCTQCNRSDLRTCSSCKWCDICSVKYLGFFLPGMPCFAKKDAVGAGTFHPTAKFIVSDSMEVFESSSVKAIEIMSSMVKNFNGIKTCTIRVAPHHIQQLILRSLLGSHRVLTETFPEEESDGEASYAAGCENASEAETAGSFELTFDSAQIIDEI